MPSPLGANWLDYIHHKLRMLKRGMDVYTTDKYTRLSLDQYIESTRAIDQYLGKMVDYKSAIIYFGAANIRPDLPFRIKKHVRAPGIRKIIRAAKKRNNCFVIPTPENYTSQTCAECYGRFDRRTRNDRFKICQNCCPNPTAMLPSIIVAQMNRRDLPDYRKLDRIVNAEHHLPNAGNLTSKVEVHRKNWQLNPVTGIMENAVNEELLAEDEIGAENQRDPQNQRTRKKTVWNRDIVAAKCILIKGNVSILLEWHLLWFCLLISFNFAGHCDLFGLPIHPALLGPVAN